MEEVKTLETAHGKPLTVSEDNVPSLMHLPHSVCLSFSVPVASLTF